MSTRHQICEQMQGCIFEFRVYSARLQSVQRMFLQTMYVRLTIDMVVQ